jgi:hypothetical protein
MYVRRGAVAVVGTVVRNDTLCVPYTGGPETCTFNNPAPGDWYIMLQAFSPYEGETLTATVAPNTFIMQTCGASGAIGPTQGQCNTAYATSTTAVSVVNGVQNWTVPHTGRYRIFARGAAGASATPGFVGGRGAQVQGDFNLTAGQVLGIAVGQAGAATLESNGGGGGGSFVVRAGVPLMVAGGGGGMRAAANQNGCDAPISTFGGVGVPSPTSACAVKVSGEGLGGALSSTSSYGAAGGGFSGNGADDFFWTGSPVIGTGGRSWAAGLIGGTPQNQASCTTPGNGPGIGGFGGGGAGNGCFGGGGGGGYSGGDGGWVAGGGGSLNAGANPVNTAGVGTGNGFVVLQYIGPAI